MALLCLLMFPAIAITQTVVISDFPLGTGGSVGEDFFKPYQSQLQAIADTMQKYPLVGAIVTGGADGETFRRANDAMNPALALGRAHALRNILVNNFGIDSTRITLQSEDVKARGPRYRHATVRIAWETSKIKAGLRGMSARLDTVSAKLDTVVNRPPVEQYITQVTESISETMGLQLSAGVASTPFGAIPIVSGAVTWERILFVEVIAGHTFWNSSFSIDGEKLDTRRRLVGGLVTLFPWENKPVAIAAGWIRTEDISQQFFEYVRMTEGPLIGIRVRPYDFISITGAYFPAKRRIVTDPVQISNINEIMVFMTVHTIFGGKK